MARENAGGRWNADSTCTTAAALAQEMIGAARTAANQAAMDADTPAAAEKAQADAERERDNARAALADVNTFAGEVVEAKDDADESKRGERLTRDLADEVEAARIANAAAAKAARDAAEAVTTLAGTEGATVQQGIDARDASNRAKAEAEKARAAHGEAIAAETARDLAAAKTARGEAEAAQEAAQDALGEITAVIAGLEDDIQRPRDVQAARGEAMGSYEKADADATKAEKAAEAAEKAAPGSPGAIAAREAATAARTAADAAKEAHDAITDDMTKAQADAKAAEAASEAGKANTAYMTAKAENDGVQNSASVVAEGNRKRDVRDATKAAKDAYEAAKKASDAADKAADAAETARDNAEAAYMKAMAARTDSAEAKKQYEAAEAAAEAARMAAGDAEQAYMDAKAAHDGIDPAGSGEAAKGAQDTAETKQGEAKDEQGTAETQQGLAEDAEEKAVDAADKHVLSLFLAANGAHVEDLETTANVNEKAAHVKSVGAAMAAIANATNGAQAGSTTGGATWPGDTVDNPATDDDEFSAGKLTINVNPGGSAPIVSETRASKAATDLNSDGDFIDDGENPRIIQTARQIDDLGVFAGYDLWEDDGDATTTTDRARAIVFTNKKQGDDSKLAVVGGAARSVKGQTVSAGELSNVGSQGNTITGVTWTPSGEAPLTGTLTCGDTCNIVLGDEGAVTTITGYTFTGSRAAVEAVTAADAAEDNDYLMFGLWLEESDDGATDTFGAFAFGGTGYAVSVQNAVTGKATYSGKAAGAHHRTGEGVNWFHGDASLTANFATAAAPGTVSGSISNIRVNGGAAMSAPIYLGEATLTDGAATFNGAAFMGAETAPGASTHEFDGTWSGSFFGATDDDDGTDDVNESVTAPLAAAGTFGVTKSTGTGDDTVVESFVGAFGAHKQ